MFSSINFTWREYWLRNIREKQEGKIRSIPLKNQSSLRPPSQLTVTEASAIISPRRTGGVTLDTPSGFSQIYQKGRFDAPPFLSHMFIHHSHTCKILDKGYARSGHQVKSSDLTSEKVWMLAIVTPNDRSLWNLQRWEKIEMRLFWAKTLRNALKHLVTGRLDTLNRNIATSDPSSCRQGHVRSWMVTSGFSAITFDRLTETS